MNNYLFNSDSPQEEPLFDGLETSHFQLPNILIPVAPDKREEVEGFFVLENCGLPESGQKNLNEITGTPFKAGLAGLKVHPAPIQPALEENYTRALIMLANSIDRCDQSGHSHLTSLWALRLARQIGLREEEIQNVCLAGKIHDVGKAVVSREILVKPGPLTASEWLIIRQHPAYGAMLLEPSKSLRKLQPMVRWHHERFDGSGYPDGIQGVEIPLGARILAVVDAFSTMISGRAYRDPISSLNALKELIRCRGTQFDPDVVDNMAICFKK